MPDFQRTGNLLGSKIIDTIFIVAPCLKTEHLSGGIWPERHDSFGYYWILELQKFRIRKNIFIIDINFLI